MAEFTKPTLPRLDTQLANQLESLEPMSERLVSAIADVLSIKRDSIQLFDSFTELGGDESAATKLRRSCSSRGMSLADSDILRCKTIAELQTCLRPIVVEKESEEDDVSSPASETFSLPAGKSSSLDDSCSSRSRASSDAREHKSAVEVEQTERLLTSTSQVPQAALVQPKAGYFEGKLVAFVTLSGTSKSERGSRECDVQLVPQSQHHFAGGQIAALRMLLENSTTITALPTAWIILEQMPLTETGPCDRRKLQSFVQNINEETYKQIMSLESRELLQEPSTDMERTLQRILSRVLKMPLERIGMNFSFSQLGGDGISALQLVAACRVESICISPEDVAKSDSIAHLAFLASWKGNTPARWDEECPDGFKLSPMQQLYFQTAVGGDSDLRTHYGREYRFNQSMLLKIASSVSLEDVHAAIEAIVGHHSMLRSRFRFSGTWAQNVLSEIQDSYQFGDHAVSTNEEILDVIRQAQSFIDIETGPVFAVEHIRTMDGQQMLYIVAHHLVVDLISWRVIIHDLNELLQSGSLFSERAMPFRRWNELQDEEITSLEHSTALPFETRAGDFAFWGVDAARNTYGDAAEVSFALSPELTAILQTTCNQAFRTDSTDIYLAALLLSFRQTFPDRAPPAVWNQEHGREPWSRDIDIGETVGWFTTLCPLWLALNSSDDFIHVLRQMKDLRRSIPKRGWAYFASRFLGPDADKFQSEDWPFEIMFTYAGSLQQLEAENGVLEQVPIPGRTLDSETSDIGPYVGRIALFEVSTMIDQGVAKVKFLYNKRSKHQARILTWITNYEHLLLEAIGRLRYRSQELTLADVPLLNANYEGLAKLNSDRLLALNITSARDIENVYPATPAQEEMLITQSRSIDSCHNHVIFEFVSPTRLPLESSRICTAWQQTVAKHPALRTVFIESISEDGLYDQVILRKCSPDMLFIDVGSKDDALQALNTLPALKSSGSEPRHRLSVCKTPKTAFVKIEISQALCDSLSLEKLVGDLKRAYATTKTSPKNLEFSYPDYVQLLRSTRFSSSLDFWKLQLGESKPCLFPKLASSGDGQAQPTTFKIETTMAHLDNFCKSTGVKRATVLRLAWGLVLRAFTGSSRVCFAFRHSGRDAPFAPDGLDGAIGSFETTLICALDLWAHRSLESAVQATEEQLSLYLPHQHTPVSAIQNALGLRGERLFNTCFSFHDDALSGLKSKFSTARQLDLPCVMAFNTADHDIDVSVLVRDGQLDVTLHQGILTSVQAENVASVFGCAVKAIIGSPNGSIGGVDLFSDRDYAQLPQNVSDGKLTKPEMAIHQMIGRISLVLPENPAVCGWDGKLTYKQLTKLVSRLSHYLVDLGVEPGLTVPVVLGKSIWSSVAILAVLKAGGCFTPIDEEEGHFAETIITQVKAKIVLATDMKSKRFEGMVESLVVVNDTLFTAILPSETRCPKPKPTDPACMIYTSSSSKSKEPRGMFFTHEAITTAFSAQGKSLAIEKESRVLQLSSFTSDTALAEILTTLVSGGCVCVPTSAERLGDFAGAVNRMQVNWTYFTPVLARRLDPEQVPSLRTVCFRTRRLDEDTYLRWAQKTRVLLSYGAPDICPLGISIMEVSSTDQLTRIAPPFIGKFWIVNPEDHRGLMPVGTVGELVIESPTLAYKLMKNHTALATLQAQQVTGEDGIFQTRFFKTGHRVRYMDDGTMELITTARDDVAMNGKVISVPTVEQHLRRCLGQGIDVAVEAVTSRDSILVLAAFVELGDLFDGPDDLSLLTATTRERAYMARKLVENSSHPALPPHMAPTVFVPVRRLPMTSSLKVNRRKLQKLASNLDLAQLGQLASVPSPDDINTPGIKPLPLTQVEERMRDIWARLLEIEPRSISATQSFLRLGGDNYLVARLVVACRKEGLIISVADVLENFTLTELCQSITLSEECFVEETVPDSYQMMMPPEIVADINYVRTFIAPQVGIDSAAITDIAEASASQIRSLESGLRASRTNINYFVFNFSGFVDYKKLEAACQTLANVHPILRTSFLTHNRNLFQVVNSAFSPEFTRYQCPGWRLASLEEKVLKKDAASSISLSVPVTRFFFLDAGKQSTLVMRLSAAQYDDSSLPLLIQDLKRIYGGGGQNTPFRPSYAEFARCARMANEHGAIEHWSTLLQGSTMTQVVAQTKPQQPTANARTIDQHIHVPTASTSDIGIPFDTVLKAAWSIVLATLSGSGDVVFGEVVDGRHVRVPSAHGVSAVLGPVANTIPVRVRFSDAPLTPLELLQKVHSQRVAAIPYENMGMLELVEKCTTWPYWLQFSTTVQHRYRDVASEKRFNIGGATCNFKVVESSHKDLHDISVVSTQPRPDTAHITLTFCEHRVPVSFAEDALKMLCSAIEMLTAPSVSSHTVVGSAIEFSQMTRQIPLPQLDFFDTPASQQGHLLSESQRSVIQEVVAQAWTSILDPRAHGVPEPHVHNAAFYDLWGSLIPAAQLAMYLSRTLPTRLGMDGLDIAMEDIIENPCMSKQFELVSRKVLARNSNKRKPSSGPMMMPPSPGVWGRSIRKIRGSDSRESHNHINMMPDHSRSASATSGVSSDGMHSGASTGATSQPPAAPAPGSSFSPVRELPSPLSATTPGRGLAFTPVTTVLSPAGEGADTVSPLSPVDTKSKKNVMRRASHIMGRFKTSPTTPVAMVSPA